MTKVTVKHTSIEIQPYVLGQSPSLEKQLSVWDKVNYKMINVGLEYIEEEQKLLIPRGIGTSFLEKEFNTTAFMDSKHDDVQHTKFKVNIKPRNDNQKEAIAYILGEGKYKGNRKYSRHMLTLDTGEGKTYCSVTALGFMQMRAAIVVPKNGLMTQWEERLFQYTNITEWDIYRISGSKSIEKLMKMKDKDIKYKIFLISHSTIRSYGDRNGWGAVTELFKKMRIGVKIYDEAHLHMHNMLKMDLYSNTKYTLYLTATAGRSNHNEDFIYNRVFANIPNFFVHKEKEDNYMNMMILQYDSAPSGVLQATYRNMHGLDTNKYMDYCVEEKGSTLFFKSIFLVLDSIEQKLAENPDMRIVFLLKKLTATRIVKEGILQRYPHFAGNIGMYTSDMKTKEKKEAQLQKQIILSTTKSLGTGDDIPGLHYLVMCEPYRSEITAKQVSGRLRNIGDVTYLEIIDMGFSSCRDQFKARKKFLLKRAKQFTIVNVK